MTTPSHPNNRKQSAKGNGTNCEIPPRPNSRKIMQNGRPNSVQKPVSALPLTEGNPKKDNYMVESSD